MVSSNTNNNNKRVIIDDSRRGLGADLADLPQLILTRRYARRE